MRECHAVRDRASGEKCDGKQMTWSVCTVHFEHYYYALHAGVRMPLFKNIPYTGVRSGA
jgi:hypothetical protein